jgi:hypothetical protein
MSLTEKEAVAKWCPYSRVIERDCDGSTRSRNRVVVLDDAGGIVKDISHNLVGANCIGPRCMAWRWAGNVFLQNSASRGGYCGLAGKP